MRTRLLPCWRRWTVGAIVIGSTVLGSQAGGSAHERLYLIDGSGGVLVTYDPVTLERLSLQLTGLLVGMQSLTYGQGRLYSIEFNIGLWMDQLVSLHPASAVAKQVGPTGVSYSTFPSVKYDPTRDEFFVLYQQFTTPAEVWYPTLYRVDPATGQMTYINRVDIGQPPFRFFPLAMAISPTGEAFVSQPSIVLNGPGIARLDLETGELIFLGHVPVGLGKFRDMSFDSSGRMWVIYDDGADNAKDGIY